MAFSILGSARSCKKPGSALIASSKNCAALDRPGWDLDFLRSLFQTKKSSKVESRPTNEKKTQQGGPVRARGSREPQYSPYIIEQARSAGRKTRSRSGEQQNGQERKGGTNSRRSQSLEVLVGDVSAAGNKNQVVSFHYIFFRTSGRKNYCKEASHFMLFKIFLVKQKLTLQ
ncbi:hypothetical protein TNCV_2575371 [Trichonephila clavipes]|uniref:Uncharacterized protein n=1 Tax=Trichonephila clavipes TaxID=2585209 RepID=A0A8X6REA6_TRICX|nr:hypothetical protein TNCV_2575371 [Trichonephila clavipes]